MSDRDKRRAGRLFKSGSSKRTGRDTDGRAGSKPDRKSDKHIEPGRGKSPFSGDSDRSDNANREQRRSAGSSSQNDRPAEAHRGGYSPPVRVYGARPKFGDSNSGEGSRKIAAPRLNDQPAQRKALRVIPVRRMAVEETNTGRSQNTPDNKGITEKDGGERIARVMARAGLCSRRDAELWIAQGRVAVNGHILDNPAHNVCAQDKVSVDGKPLAAREPTRLFLFHKPRGTVTTDRDPEGRTTIFDWLARHRPELPRLMTIGRLDINTEGLLLMTNDGGLARVLELPRTGWLRRYRVRAHGVTNQAMLDTLRQGVRIDDVDYLPIEARLDREQGSNVWLTIGLREGKNREVRRVLAYLGLEVNRLIRISFGPFQLGDLIEGDIDEVKKRILREQLGDALIAQAGADFETPVEEQRLIRRHDTETRAKYSSDASERAASGKRGRDSGGRESGGNKSGGKFSHDKQDRTPDRNAGRSDRNTIRSTGRQEHTERFSSVRKTELQAEQPEKRAERPLPGARRHVTALRAERETRQSGERLKVERGATQDRKGRTVAVEHVRAADAKGAFEPVNRNGRRFATERQADRARTGGERAGRAKPDRTHNAQKTGDGRAAVGRPGESRSGEGRQSPRRSGEGSGGGPRTRTRSGEGPQTAQQQADRPFVRKRAEADMPSRRAVSNSVSRDTGEGAGRRFEGGRPSRFEKGADRTAAYDSKRSSGASKSPGTGRYEGRDANPARKNTANPGENFQKRGPSRNNAGARDGGADARPAGRSDFSRGGGKGGPRKNPPRNKR